MPEPSAPRLASLARIVAGSASQRLYEAERLIDQRRFIEARAQLAHIRSRLIEAERLITEAMEISSGDEGLIP